MAGVGADLKERPRASATITKYGALVLERSCCHICLHAREAGTRYETRAEPHKSYDGYRATHLTRVNICDGEKKPSTCVSRVDMASGDHKLGAHFVEKLQMRGGRAVYAPATTCARMWMSVLRHQVPDASPSEGSWPTSRRGIHRPAHTLVRPVRTSH